MWNSRLVIVRCTNYKDTLISCDNYQTAIAANFIQFLRELQVLLPGQIVTIREVWPFDKHSSPFSLILSKHMCQNSTQHGSYWINSGSNQTQTEKGQLRETERQCIYTTCTIHIYSLNSTNEDFNTQMFIKCITSKHRFINQEAILVKYMTKVNVPATLVDFITCSCYWVWEIQGTDLNNNGYRKSLIPCWPIQQTIPLTFKLD